MSVADMLDARSRRRPRTRTVVGADGDAERQWLALTNRRYTCLANEVALLGTEHEGEWRGEWAELLARWRALFAQLQGLSGSDWRAQAREVMREVSWYDRQLDDAIATYEREAGRESRCETTREANARLIAEARRRDAEGTPIGDIARAGMWIGGGLIVIGVVYAVVKVSEAQAAAQAAAPAVLRVVA